jgi:Fur family transcriptional regulator, ferric uptake regulator
MKKNFIFIDGDHMVLNEKGLVETWLNGLAASGYRLTEARRSIVEIMATSQRALAPLHIYDLGRKGHSKLGLVTVYRTLEKLEELGFVQRVHQPHGCHMYWRAGQGHEHILLCTSCGQAEYFSGDNLAALTQKIAKRSGYQIQEHWLQLNGLCAKCQGWQDATEA